MKERDNVMRFNCNWTLELMHEKEKCPKSGGANACHFTTHLFICPAVKAVVPHRKLVFDTQSPDGGQVVALLSVEPVSPPAGAQVVVMVALLSVELVEGMAIAS